MVQAQLLPVSWGPQFILGVIRNLVPLQGGAPGQAAYHATSAGAKAMLTGGNAHSLVSPRLLHPGGTSSEPAEAYAC